MLTGLPDCNGTEHAGEIADMAIEITTRIYHMEIPHMPGLRLRVRIGCHSGTEVHTKFASVVKY
jgi:hypothetical protein